MREFSSEAGGILCGKSTGIEIKMGKQREREW